MAILTGCSGSSGGSEDSDGSDVSPTAAVTASADQVTLTSDSDTADVSGSADAVAGDVVATDANGRAQLDYQDGSLTRLGGSTSLIIGELSDASAQRTIVDLEVGQTWHRVEKLVAEDAAFEVSTPVGVAAVHGTAFSVTCTADEVCTVQVIEGEVDFTRTNGTTVTVGAFQGLTLPSADGAALAAVPLTDAELSEPWLSDNAASDGVSLDKPDPGDALIGEWNVTVVTDEGALSTTLRDLPDPVTVSVLSCEPTCIVQVGSDSSLALQFTEQPNGTFAGPSTSTEGTVCLNGNRSGDVAYIRGTSSTLTPELAADGSVESISIVDSQSVVPVIFTCVPDVSPGEYGITLTRAAP
ncbi:FecR family protein [Naasia lichenicola]|uniref:FecR family protein n=1 Tax=Naasia lichenicola TaxID=2565933 RepID=UPI00130DB9CD|nr:FecR family protein [Naasia lichenicola]